MKNFRSKYAHMRYFRSGYFRLFFVLLVILPMLVLTMQACSTGPETKASTLPIQENKSKSMESKYVANEIGAQQVAEVRFRKGSHTLDKKELEKIRKAMRDAAQTGAVNEVRIVSWADNEYPSTYTKKLPPRQRELANERAEEIKRSLESFNDVSVKTYNMAERPGALQSLLSSSDYKMKSSLEKAGVPNTHTGVKIPSFAGKAIVMVMAEPISGEKPAETEE